MALIPPDVGVRMRMQAETDLLRPIQPAHEIPSDLPELRPGQTFNARIQELLPDNTYKALVAGKQLTLQLPEGAKAGDQLELVVVDRSAKAIIARQVEAAPAGTAEGGAVPYAFAKFSPAARMISQLLPAAGETLEPAQLNRGQPLLAQPPQGQNVAAQLAAALSRSVAQSGVFYESHQSQWVTGQRPLAELLQEPQGQRSLPQAFQHAVSELSSRVSAGVERQATGQLPATAEKVGAGGTAVPAATNTTSTAPQGVPDDLRPLVQQQLEAATTHRLAWHGEVWPRQMMDWRIELENERGGDGSEQEEMRWNTTLSLITPRLGRIDAVLLLSPAGVRIGLATPYGASAADLRDEAPLLAEALEAAGVPLLSFQVKHEDEYPAGKG